MASAASKLHPSSNSLTTETKLICKVQDQQQEDYGEYVRISHSRNKSCMSQWQWGVTLPWRKMQHSSRYGFWWTAGHTLSRNSL